MKVLTNLFFKVTVSFMVLTAPAMIEGHANAGGNLLDKKAESPYASSTVIKDYIDHLKIWPVRAYVDRKSMVMSFPYVAGKAARAGEKVAAAIHAPVAPVTARAVDASMMPASEFKTAEVRRVVNESAYIFRSM